MSVLKELRTFILRGNVVDMAVGVVVGGAFGKIVSSLVSDIIMPPIGFLVGGVDFSDLKLVLKQATGDVAEISINYGTFLQTIIDFLIIATAIFFAVKAINSLSSKFEKEKEAEAPKVVEPTKEEALLTEIRDLLKEQNKTK